ncbi:hypothetical protein TUM3794_20990 [Shewanella colwelliana]|uniref:Uncharacterized protein n=1 Tax=Shewanella colwelliana TaxID=23 RepID=A0ABQ4P0U8_SHECO|nr:hypothetical protein [Shewanella colwelliana]GIU41135.1 hypothetical protein TUM3794_20990 [Shewanella colwelliana]
MTEYSTPEPMTWKYHGLRKAGRPLPLLSWDELQNPYIRQMVIDHVELLSPIHYKDKANNTWFSRLMQCSENARSDARYDFNAALRHFPKKKKHYIEVRDGVEFCRLNQELNRIFSDEGWRKLRRKFSQIHKRESTVRPQMKASTYSQLTDFKDSNGYESLDVAILELLATWNANNPEDAELEEE